MSGVVSVVFVEHEIYTLLTPQLLYILEVNSLSGAESQITMFDVRTNKGR